MLLADSTEVAQAGKLAGCYAVHELGSWPAPAQLAARICKLLQVRPWAAGSAAGPQAAAALPALAAVLQAAAAGQGAGVGVAAPEAGQEEEEGDDVIDMLLLSLDAAHAPGSGGTSRIDARMSIAEGGAAAGGHKPDAAAGHGTSASGARSQARAALAWADELLSRLNQVPGFRDTVLLSLVVGPGEQPLSRQPLLAQEQPLLPFEEGPRQQPLTALQPAAPSVAAAGCPPVRRPLQSYQLAGRHRVAVDGQSPALVVHRLAGVTRRVPRRPAGWAVLKVVSVCAAACCLHLRACVHAPSPDPCLRTQPNMRSAPSPRAQGGRRCGAVPGRRAVARGGGLHPGRAPAARGGLQAGAGAQVWGLISRSRVSHGDTWDAAGPSRRSPVLQSQCHDAGLRCEHRGQPLPGGLLHDAR